MFKRYCIIKFAFANKRGNIGTGILDGSLCSDHFCVGFLRVFLEGVRFLWLAK